MLLLVVTGRELIRLKMDMFRVLYGFLNTSRKDTITLDAYM